MKSRNNQPGKKTTKNVVEKKQKVEEIADKKQDPSAQSNNQTGSLWEMLKNQLKAIFGMEDNKTIQENIIRGNQNNQRAEQKPKYNSLPKRKQNGLIKNNSLINKRKSRDKEQFIGFSNPSTKYNFNAEKFAKIEGDKDEVFRARPKINSTPLLFNEEEQNKVQQNKLNNQKGQKLKALKVKTQGNVVRFKQKGEEQCILPSIRPKVQYTQLLRKHDILADVSHTVSLLRDKNRQQDWGYQPVSLSYPKPSSSLLGSIKAVRQRRLNLAKK